ncbi:uncharacterized protein LOC106054822 isoform X2 [Biomphalaria glabrata]|uniref:Uncharacterized protein LOC106054822 isoform X2 n=1 Tax=Biomphalaria glabrata TaxID=6526 RepID=A0A9W2YC51_BIOGL|nr:uncharacterized protein LOC106054822 isoform X2 [Biomphalaria glabrata]
MYKNRCRFVSKMTWKLFAAFSFCLCNYQCRCSEQDTPEEIFKLEVEQQRVKPGEAINFSVVYTRLFLENDFLITVYQFGAVIEQCISPAVYHRAGSEELSLSARYSRDFEIVFARVGIYKVVASIEWTMFNSSIVMIVILPQEIERYFAKCKGILFTANGFALSHYLNGINRQVDFSEWLELKSLLTSSACWNVTNSNVVWHIEKHGQKIYSDRSDPFWCPHSSHIGQVNLTTYMINHASTFVPLPPMSSPEITLQPYSLPPGLFRICLHIILTYSNFKHCGFLLRQATHEDVTDMILTSFWPREYSFFWPNNNDLKLDASETFFYYQHPDSGNIGDIGLRAKWVCGSLHICYSIAKNLNSSFHEVSYNSKSIDLPFSGFALQLLSSWVKDFEDQINVTLIISVVDPITNLTGVKVKRWIVIFTDSSVQYYIPFFRIRRLSNQWRIITPTRSLLLAIACVMCEHLERDYLNFTWAIIKINSSSENGNWSLQDLNYIKYQSFYYGINLLGLRMSKFRVICFLTYINEEEDVKLWSYSIRTFRISDIPQTEPIIIQPSVGFYKQHRYETIRHLYFRINTSSVLKASPSSYPLFFNTFNFRETSDLLTSSVETVFNIHLAANELPGLIIGGAFGGFAYLQKYMFITKNIIFYYNTTKVMSEIEDIVERFASTDDYRLLRPLFSIASTVQNEYPEKIQSMTARILAHFLDLDHSNIVLAEYRSMLHRLSDIVRNFQNADMQLIYLLLKVIMLIFDLNKTYYCEYYDLQSLSVYVIILEKAAVVIEQYLMTISNRTSPTELRMKIYTMPFDVTPYPVKASLNSEIFYLQAFWVDSSAYEQVELLLNNTDVHVYIDVRKEMFHPLTIDTNVHLSGFRHDRYLPAAYYGVPLNAPEVYINIDQKGFNPYPLKTQNEDMFNIFFDFGDNEAEISKPPPSEHVLKYVIDEKLNIKDSDCLIIQFPTSTMRDTLVKIWSSSKYNLIVRRIKSSFETDIQDIFDVVPETLPVSFFPSYGNINADLRSIILPKLSTHEIISKKASSWYIMIHLQIGMTYRGKMPFFNNTNEKIFITCQQLACVKLMEIGGTWTHEDCHATHFSLGTPYRLNCICASGNIFTGGVNTCGHKMPRLQFQVDRFTLITSKSTLIQVFFVLVLVCFISLAIICRTRKLDRLERSLGNVHSSFELCNPYHKYQYLVCVVTGWLSGSFKTNPVLVIVGSNNISQKYYLILEDSYYKAGSEVWFLISSPIYLGNLQFAIIGVESGVIGKHTWYLSMLFLKDLSTEQDWYCSINCWLHHSYVVKPFNTFASQGKTRFFLEKFLRFLTTLHVFMGIVYNVPGSKFNKTQHALSCFVTVLLTMAMTTRQQQEKDANYADWIFYASFGIASIYSVIVNIFLSLARPSYNDRNRLQWPCTIKHEELSYFEVTKEKCLTSKARKVPLYKPEEREVLSHNVEFDTNVDPCEWNISLSTFLFNAKINKERLSVPSSLEFLQAHGRSRRVRDSTLHMAEIAPFLDRIKSGLTHSLLSKIALLLTLPTYFINSVLILTAISLLYMIVRNAFMLKQSLDDDYYTNLGASLVMTAFLIQPAIIFLIALLLSERWQDFRHEAESRVRDNCKAFAMRVKMLALRKVQLSKSWKQQPVQYNDKYIDFIRAKCMQISVSTAGKISSSTTAAASFTVSTKKYRMFIAILLMIVIMNLRSSHTRSSFLQSSLFKTILDYRNTEEQMVLIDNIWEELLTSSYFGFRNQLANINTTATLFSVSTVNVMQVRIYPPDVSHMPHEIIPNVNETLKNFKYEDRNFAYTWKKVTLRDIGSGAYTYVPDESMVSAFDGGYEFVYTLKDQRPSFLLDLKSRNWLDEYTIYVVIGTVFYNADTKMITFVQTQFEKIEVGMFLKSHNVATLLMFDTPYANLQLLTCKILFGIEAVIEIYVKVKHISCLGFRSMKKWDILMGFVEPIVYITTSVFLALEQTAYSNLIKSFKTSMTYKFTNHVNFHNFYSTSQITLLLLCGLAVINFIHAFQYVNNRLLQIFVTMLPDIYTVFFPTGCAIILVGILGHLLYMYVLEYHTLWAAITTAFSFMYAAMTNSWKIMRKENINLYVMVFSFLLNYIILNHFVAVINVLYNQVKLEQPRKTEKQPKRLHFSS